MKKKLNESRNAIKKKEQQKALLEKEYIETFKQAFDFKRTYVHSHVGVRYFSSTLLPFTVGNL